ncbi:disulfide bond formation protein DsbD [Puteibacter caeruleilacunae]|nr:disulfide bond formation protein DsbD [Puteibacter caeruleilacunae]
MRIRVLLFSLFLFIGFSGMSQILEPVKWKFSSKKLSELEYELTFIASIDDGWHLYSSDLPEGGPIKTTFNFEENKSYQFSSDLVAPKAIETFDDMFQMKIRYFEHKAVFTRNVKLKPGAKVEVKGYVEFMSCNDETCTPPMEADFEFKLEASAGKTAKVAKPAQKEVVKAETIVPAVKSVEKEEEKKEVIAAAKIEKASPVQQQESKEESGSLWVFFALAFLGGLAAIVTPCVFPMIPMTVSFFMHSSESKVKAKLHGLFYGFSIIVLYTVIGTVVAVSFGPDAANFLSTHWLPNIIFFVVFVLFAFSFFGMFEIVLPSWMVNKSDRQADKGGFMGAFFMALTLVLVSFSCTGPIVGTILVESAGGQVLKPIIGMFGFAAAFALPFTLFALFPSWLNNLPKSGGWLNSVKVVLGFLELALGLKFLSIADQTYHWGILDREVYLAFWIVIFILLGFYLLGKLKFAHDSEVKHISVPRLMLAIISFSFVVYLTPGMFGAPLKALSGYLPPQTTHDFDLNKIVRDEIKMAGGVGSGSVADNGLCEDPKYADFLHLPHGLEGYFDYEQAIRCAKEKGKPVFVDFTGHGCVNCREMEAAVWSDPRVLKKLREDFVVVALYVDDKTDLPEEDWVTSSRDGKVKKSIGKKYADFQASRFGVNSQPYYVLLDENGKELTTPKAYDLNADNFVKFLDEGLKNFNTK